MGNLDNFKAVTAAAVISTAATQIPAHAQDSVTKDTQKEIAALVAQCDKNGDGIKGIFETTCYTKGEADIIEKENNKLKEEIANNREEIANNREEIANNREEIMILNKKGQQLAQQALSHLQ